LLTTLPGVGDKVADCVLLFGCGHTEAFPVDVWVARLLADWFGLTCKSRPAMAKEARARLGIHAGLMQQFLFHAARVGAMALGD
jgi:N-glycosylase/DNA lyase